MKKNVLALSIAAMIGGLGFVGSAVAAGTVTVAPSGAGHMLLVPYYTAQNGNMTVLHVVNTDTTNGKAVKVRFRGASNSDDVLDFQVFMSPGDVWTAAVTQGADGVAQLTTADNTCTLPSLAGVTQSFVQDRLSPTLSAADKANNTREGYVEILNMADIDAATTYVVGGVTGHSALYTATKHVGGVAPCTAAVLNSTLSVGNATTPLAATTVTNAGAIGLIAPSTGLVGSWYVINVPQTTTYAGAMTAITAVGTTAAVFSPQAMGVTSGMVSADPLFAASVLTKQDYDVPDLSTPYVPANTAPVQATDLTAALASTSVINQYANDAGINAKTDWVFSMPTRRYSIAANYAAPVGQAIALTTQTGTVTMQNSATAATAYRYINSDVTSFFTAITGASPAATATNTTVNAIGQICTTAKGQVFYDREETSKTSGAVFSPGTVSTTQLCGEVSVLSFADAGASVLGATVARTNVTGAYTNGWGQFNFAAAVPVIGASFIKLSNPAAVAGTSGTYGVTWPHAYK